MAAIDAVPNVATILVTASFPIWNIPFSTPLGIPIARIFLIILPSGFNSDLTGRDVLIVEDILDTGITLSKLVPVLKMRNPGSVKICTILSKPSRRMADIEPDYCGFEVPDEFVVGYGLDYDEKYRNLPYVGVLKPEVYSGE